LIIAKVDYVSTKSRIRKNFTLEKEELEFKNEDITNFIKDIYCTIIDPSDILAIDIKIYNIKDKELMMSEIINEILLFNKNILSNNHYGIGINVRDLIINIQYFQGDIFSQCKE